MKYLFLILAIISNVACNQQTASAKEDLKDNGIQHTDTATERVGVDTGLADTNKTDTISEASFQVNKLIVAGKSIGNIRIGMNDSKLEIFGKPDMSDAAMGKAWLTWYGKKPDEHNNKTQLNVYTTYKDTGMSSKTVQQVRTTSSFFETANGLHVYAALNEIKQGFPKIKKVATYSEEGRDIDVYDVQQQGIAFETAPANNQQTCIGIIIHKPGVKVTQVYISLHPDMHIL